MTPELRLVADAEITARGVGRGEVVVRTADLFFVARLHAGLSVDSVAALLENSADGRLRRLYRAGLLAWRLPGLLEVEPLATGLEPAIPMVLPGPVPLSRFAVLHREGDAWLLDSGLSRWRGRLTRAGVRTLMEGDEAGWFAGLLDLVGLLDADDERAADWSVHDRLFHSRARGGLDFPGQPARERGVPPEPAFRGSAAGITLPRPDGPEPDEPSLWDATENRRTRRDFADRPVPWRALGHLLWRTLRVQRVSPADPADPLSYESVLRPVPSGGAMHATDLWLFCQNVADLPPGAYRYDPVAHTLVLAGPVPERQPAPVLGLITARHRRTAWKYEPIALSLETQDVGVQWMALQLAAGAVGLSVVPLGGGPTAPATDLLGLDPLVDAPVGQFLLGCVEGGH